MGVPLSVKQKIVLSLWLVTFLLLVFSGTVAALWFTSDQANRLDDFLSRDVRSVQDTLDTYFDINPGEGPTFDNVDNPDFQTFLHRFLQERLNKPLPYKTTLGVFTLRGTKIQSSNVALDLMTGKPVDNRDFQILTVTGFPTYRMAVIPLLHKGQALATIRLACLTVTLGEVWDSFLFSLVLVLGLVFVSFGALGTILIHWSLRPVREMSLSAQDISETHLDLRLSVPPGQDEVAQMARTLNHLLARLEQDFEFEEALVGQLSHELRTPLAILRGRNEVALERIPIPQERVQQVLEDNLADIDNVAALLNTLLSLARLDSRIDPVKLQPCDLAEILEDLIDELVPLWEEKDLSFHLVLPGKETSWARCPRLWTLGDPVLLRQVLLNILTNAYKYTPKGSRIHLTIEADGSVDAPVWTIVFRNPGPAIPEESINLVFKRFYRVEVQDPDGIEKAAGIGQKGFGLGLSIAKALVELHGGRIRAYNPPQGGAAFEIVLPRSPSPNVSDPRRIP